MDRMSAILEIAFRTAFHPKTLVIHRERFAQSSTANIIIPLLCWRRRGRVSKPNNLDILLIHNRNYQTILEKSIQYLGIEDYKVVSPQLPRGVWRNSFIIPTILRCCQESTAEFVFYIDSDDALLIGDPAHAVNILQDSGGDILFSTTRYGHFHQMPQAEQWFRSQAAGRGYGTSKAIYPNAGVFVARREFMVEFLHVANKFVTEDDLSADEFAELRRHTPMPNFPYGCGSKQSIFRFIAPNFEGRVRIDYEQRLALRR